MSNETPAANPDRKHSKPVAWLLGRQLIGSVKGILLYAAYGKKLDPRDWMQASVYPDPDPIEALKLWRVAYEQAHPQEAADPAIGNEAFWNGRDEFWFDYLADAGDGTKAMYSLAYLCLSNLWVKNLVTELPATAGEREIKVKAGHKGFAKSLPRGEFLFIGGDTAYHAADYMTLASRFHQPFEWAYEDLARNKGISREGPARPVFGIPGNHDYYDQLDGFRRQFRQPIRDEPVPGEDAANIDRAQLGVAGFRRVQEASYVAVQLPFGWWLWGLDTEVGQIDRRQQRFFRRLGAKKFDAPDDIEPPSKLIIATCSPTTFHGKIAEKEDYKAADAIGQLGLSQPFLPDKKFDDGTYDLSTTGDSKIDPGQCRLELSGDVHQYARYWGPKAPPAEHSRADAKAPRESAGSYASIVSGLGGAFHHPSTTYDDQVQEQILYPTETKSRDAVAERIFKFWNIWGGGYVWLAGAIIAFIIYFGAIVTPSNRQFLSNLSPVAWVLQMDRETITAGAVSVPSNSATKISEALNQSACGEVKSFFIWRWTGISETWLPPGPCRPENTKYFFLTSISDFGNWPADFQIGTLLVLAALIATLLTFIFSNRIFGTTDQDSLGAESRPSEEVMEGGEKRIKPRKTDPEIHATPNKRLVGIVAPTSLAVFLGLLTLNPYRGHISPFVNSLLVLFSIIWAVAAIMLSVRYSEYLFKKGHKAYIDNFDWILPWVLTAVAVLSLAMGFWFFGKNNPAAFLISDIAFIVTLVGVFFLLWFLPFLIGGELLKNRGVSKPVRYIGTALFGFWHAVLQLAIPLLLIRRGDAVTWVVAAAIVFLSIPIGTACLKKNSKAGLAFFWVLLGGLVLVLPWLTSYLHFRAPFANPSWNGWSGLWPSFLAASVGAVMCCLWFGWYLAVCFIFNGHNNEVGGAARIEEFKQFIRFRIDQNGITGYVIALDDVSMIGKPVPGEARKYDGGDLHPRLIDVFRLEVKP